MIVKILREFGGHKIGTLINARNSPGINLISVQSAKESATTFVEVIRSIAIEQKYIEILKPRPWKTPQKCSEEQQTLSLPKE